MGIRREQGPAGRRVAGVTILIMAVLGPATLYAQAPSLVRSSASIVAAGAPVSASEPDAAPVRLLVGRSTLIDVGSPIRRVSLTSADIADALVTAPDQLLINGKFPGTISMFIWDRGGAIRRYEVIVQRDLARLAEQMTQLFPGEAIQVQSNGKDVVLAGKVSTKEVADKAVTIAAGYVEKKEEVVSLLQVEGPSQVLLRVRFAEVSRSAMTELGLGLFTSPTGVKNTLGRITTQQFAAPGFTELKYSKPDFDFGTTPSTAEGKFTFGDFLNLFLFSEKYDLGAMLRALQTKGLFQSLAEPNLVAESGKEASFLAGGEFPIPIAQASGANVAISVVFKEFGIRLGFTPTVTGDRIRLKVKPEVSTLDFNNAVVLQGFRIPALSTRRTETELELQDRQTFAIAGLMNNTMISSMQRIPGIGDIPILGLLFRSKAAQKEQTELVVMITPEVLPRNSSGVASQLPRPVEPFLPPVPPNKSIDPPPPAFQSSPKSSSRTEVASPAAAVIDRRANEALGPAKAVSTVQAPAPSTPVAPAADLSKPKTASVPASSEMRLLTPEDPKAAERARKQEWEAREPERKAKAAEARSAAKRAEEDRRKAEDQKKQQEKMAREQARRDAEVAKLTSEAAQRQAEEDRRKRKAEAEQQAKQAEEDRRKAEDQKRQQEQMAREQAKRDAEIAKRTAEVEQRQGELVRRQQKAFDEATAKLRAAEAAYQLELDKIRQQ